MTLIIGHRGASKAFPENTLEGFVAAREMGADWVELDIRRTKDGEIVVHHDPCTSDGRVIAQTKHASLPDYVPTLAEALEACGDMGVNIEIKNDPAEEDFDPEHLMAEPMMEIARAHRSYDQLLISSFDMGAINAVRDRNANFPTALLTEDPLGPEVAVGRVVAHGHAAINPSDELVTPRWLDETEAAGLSLYVWTVNDPDRIRELADLGVAGIITDVPDVAVKVLR